MRKPSQAGLKARQLLALMPLFIACVTAAKISKPKPEPAQLAVPRIESCQANTCASCVEQEGCRWFAATIKNAETPKGTCGDLRAYNRFYEGKGDPRVVANNLMECAFDDPTMRSVLDERVAGQIQSRLAAFKQTQPAKQVTVEKGLETRFTLTPNNCYAAIVRPVPGAWLNQEVAQGRLGKSSNDRTITRRDTLSARGQLVMNMLGPVCTSTASEFVVYFSTRDGDVGNKVSIQLLERAASPAELAEARRQDAPTETLEQTCTRCWKNMKQCGAAPACTTGYVACLRQYGYGPLGCEK